jgi:hypothetical protein
MQDYPVKIGQMLYTMVDPQRGHEVAYNRWYERDHFYSGCMIGPGWFAGRRWVAPRPLKDLRFPADSPFAKPLDAGSYLAIYWVHLGNLEQATKWSGEQVVWLYQNGRGFNERDHAHTGMYLPDSNIQSREDGVPVELALNHEYKGLGVVVVEPSEGTSRDDLIRQLEEGPARRLMDPSGGVDLVCSWRVIPRPPDAQAPMSLGTDGGRDDRVVQLCFMETEPTAMWDRFHTYAKEIEQSGAGVVTFAAPFLPTVVGTDTYTDQLW